MPEFQPYNKGEKGESQNAAAQKRQWGEAVPEKRRVRQSYVIHAVLVAIVLVSVFAVLSVTVLFKAEKVIIKGECAYSREEIMAAGNIEVGVNLIRFNSSKTEEKIISKLVRLDSVSVKRVFPSSIRIKVEPAEKVFTVYSGGTYYGVSKKGRIISSEETSSGILVINGITPKLTEVGEVLEYAEDDGETAENPDALVEVAGGGMVTVTGDEEADNIEKIELIFRLVGLIEKHALSGIVRIDVADRYDIKLFNGEAGDERIEVKLGSSAQLDEKMAVAAKIIADEIEENEKGVLRVATPRKASFNPA